MRVALLSEGRLVNVEIEGGGASSIKGDVYKARVTSVNTSFQAAFVEYGGVREGFLSVQDLTGDLVTGHGSHPRIEKVLKPGRELLVQVTKDPIDQKGASMTTAVSLPGRFLVLVPGGSRLGVSKKLPDDHRSRLKEMMSGVEIPEGFGVITRTAAVNVTRKQDLIRDMTQLVRLWGTIEAKAEATRAPSLLFRDQGVAIRFLREYFTTDVTEVWVDEPELYKEVEDFFTAVMPRSRRVVKLYQDYLPLFSRYDVERQIAEMFARKVPLPSGGSIVMDRTEALVAIDVNSGRVREKSPEDTALKANLDAAREIGRQAVLRDLSGLLVIDFIDMEREGSSRAVEQELKNAFKDDKARLTFGKISRFGLLEMSRQKIRQDVTQGIFQPCIACAGTGTVRSPEFHSLHVLRRLRDTIARRDPERVVVELPVEPANYLQNRMRSVLALWEAQQQVRIEIMASPAVSHSELRFHLVLRGDDDGKMETEIVHLWGEPESDGGRGRRGRGRQPEPAEPAPGLPASTTPLTPRLTDQSDKPLRAEPRSLSRVEPDDHERSRHSSPGRDLPGQKMPEPPASTLDQVLTREEEEAASPATGLMKWLGRMLGIEGRPRDRRCRLLRLHRPRRFPPSPPRPLRRWQRRRRGRLHRPVVPSRPVASQRPGRLRFRTPRPPGLWRRRSPRGSVAAPRRRRLP
ncbi:MAG: Rne/Rng family ribonuclease [Pseudomonadota bacterium]